MKQIKVTKNEAGQRLDKLLAKVLNQAPKGFSYKMLRKKNITLNQKKADGSEKLVEGDEVQIWLSDETFEKFSQIVVPVKKAETKKAKTNLNILYQDENILILNKPIGMLSQKAKPNDTSMVEEIISYLLESNQLSEEDLRSFHPSVCNRLDRNTSGILAAGISMAGLQELSRLFQSREMHKYYLCLVKGKIDTIQRVSGYLEKNEKTNQVRICKEAHSEDAKWIETQYEPIASNGKVTLLRVLLLTGRSHQIRAHLAYLGHPLAGDSKYGDANWNRQLKEKYGLQAQLLHSYRLEMPQLEGALATVSGKVFEADLPKQFQRVLKGEQIAWQRGTPED